MPQAILNSDAPDQIVATVGEFVTLDRQPFMMVDILSEKARTTGFLMDAKADCRHEVIPGRGGGECLKCGGWYLL